MAMHTFVSHLLFNLAPPEKGFHGMKGRHESHDKYGNSPSRRDLLIALGVGGIAVALNGCQDPNTSPNTNASQNPNTSPSATASHSSDVSKSPSTPPTTSEAKKNKNTPSTKETTPAYEFKFQIAEGYEQFALKDFGKKDRKDQVNEANDYLKECGVTTIPWMEFTALAKQDPLEAARRAYQSHLDKQDVVRELLKQAKEENDITKRDAAIGIAKATLFASDANLGLKGTPSNFSGNQQVQRMMAYEIESPSVILEITGATPGVVISKEDIGHFMFEVKIKNLELPEEINEFHLLMLFEARPGGDTESGLREVDRSDDKEIVANSISAVKNNTGIFAGLGGWETKGSSK